MAGAGAEQQNRVLTSPFYLENACKLFSNGNVTGIYLPKGFHKSIFQERDHLHASCPFCPLLIHVTGNPEDLLVLHLHVPPEEV